jgi:hypothetical protein
MWSGRASLVLATFAETKVARLPGRNPATLEHVGKYLEGLKYQCLLKQQLRFKGLL